VKVTPVDDVHGREALPEVRLERSFVQRTGALEDDRLADEHGVVAVVANGEFLQTAGNEQVVARAADI
jgi:hypothetical protein